MSRFVVCSFYYFCSKFEEKFMKFQVKALIAALALTASGVASAYDAPNTGNGSLVLSVFDRTSNTSVWFDTGFKYSNFNEIGSDVADSNFDSSNSVFTFDLSTNAAFNSFISGADLSTTYFNVFAGDSLGTPAAATAGARGMISSYDISNPEAKNFTISRSPLVTATGNHDQIVAMNNNPLSYFASNVNGNVGPTSIALLGTEMSLFQTVQAGGPSSGNNFFFDNTKVTFNNGLLTISSVQTTVPVPEPESYALMALGLGVVAAAARRRKSAK
ncbi:PEP-CTERM sorting domain-containing protein [Methylophilus sp. Leaf414]|uniref:PEP-CTERM sorting domain-containing protein n=1 Tax=Methylophilus sp. Leaf414 TaxID=1736371 RepID=UPI001F2FA5BE|nr:PEP-CTERM sorting domain-containing protein [Methylophilus sp. Leaf414]